REIEAGSFPLDPALEDIHMNVEASLRERVGEAAGRLHTGRSRNDLVATDLLLYLRDAAGAARRGLAALRRTLVARAREHVDTVLPGYTHLQRAQPVRLPPHPPPAPSARVRRDARPRWPALRRPRAPARALAARRRRSRRLDPPARPRRDRGRPRLRGPGAQQHGRGRLTRRGPRVPRRGRDRDGPPL